MNIAAGINTLNVTLQRTNAINVITSVPTGGGEISVAPSGPYIDGQVVTLTATPDAPTSYFTWYFQHWTIDGVNYTDNPHITTLINTTTNVQAYFTASQNPPPGNNPVFPAPSSDTSWYWVEYNDGTYGWDDYFDVLIVHNPMIQRIVAGPYPSGATG
jgi:hypothetical protein